MEWLYSCTPGRKFIPVHMPGEITPLPCGDAGLEKFNQHARFSGKRELSDDTWRKICAAQTKYYMLMAHGKPVCRGAIETVRSDICSPREGFALGEPAQWYEISDIYTAQEYRNMGYATNMINFLRREIQAAGSTAYIRTRYDNYAMRAAIEKSGFHACRAENLKKKILLRDTWPRVLSSKTASEHIKTKYFTGMIGLTRFNSMTKSYELTVDGSRMLLADDGYSWLSIIPEDKNIMASIVFNRDNAPIEWYFDITYRNILNGENSYVYDIFLDVEYLSDGRIILLDLDELHQAADTGAISQGMHAAAWRTAHKLTGWLHSHREELFYISRQCFDILAGKLK